MTTPSPESPQQPTGRYARWSLALIILMVACATGVYHLIREGHLEQTAVLFIGLPAFIAVGIVLLAPPTRSPTVLVLWCITISLLLAGILWGEGFICILMMAPVFYLVALAVAIPIEISMRRKQKKRGFPVITDTPKRDKSLAIAILLLLPMTLEGTSRDLSFQQDETVRVTRVIAGTPAQVQDALARTPHFTAALPLYFRLGFPHPTATSGSGLNIGDRRTIHFAGGEGAPGDLVLEVTEHSPTLTRFCMLSDGSHVAHWLQWQEAVVDYQPVDAQRTRITWTLRYKRLLHPAWYFKPWERYAVGLAADYLIDNVADPNHD